MGTTGQSITLANSIIGVGILAMPFCFQQCGILLATLILLVMGLISRLCCYFLLKSALLARRRNFEFLAFHVFGPAGKLAVEVGIIGFLMGTCIAYFVVVGDLGPQIVAKMFNINQSDILRTSIMVLVSLVCVLPLGLLRNVDSLSNVSAATIAFYFCLVIKVITEAASQLLARDWHSRTEMWRPAGLLQCVPIFSMALFCQTQLFEIFESLPTLSLEKMNVVTKNAINICTCVYFTLGVFGYIAFSSHDISGNILMSLSPTMASDVIKLGFVMSVAFSFPLIIFPCRASLYSLLYKKVHSSHHDHMINNSIPQTTFRCITVAIIAVSLCISLLIPNIELVLGLVGSTIGVLICVVFPAACFVNVTFKNTNERVLAKGILVLGLVIMVLGTYANLQAAENSRLDRYEEKYTQERIDKIVEDFFENRGKKDFQEPQLKSESLPKEPYKHNNGNLLKDSEVQPPNPVPPESQSKEDLKPAKINPMIDSKESNNVNKPLDLHPKDIKTKMEEKQSNENKQDKLSNGNTEQKDNKEIKSKEETKADLKPKPKDTKSSIEDKIDIMKQEKLIETIKQHGEEQKELIKEQKEILDEIIKTKKELQQNKNEVDPNEAKKIAVESIKQIANMAIQSLGGVTEKPDLVKEKETIEKLTNDAVQEIAKKAAETIEAIKDIKNEPQSVQAQNPQSVLAQNPQPVPAQNLQPVPAQNLQPVQAQYQQPLQTQNQQPLQAQNSQPAPAQNPQPLQAQNSQPAPAQNPQPLQAQNSQPLQAQNSQPAPAQNPQPLQAQNSQPAPAQNPQQVQAQNPQPAPAQNPQVPNIENGAINSNAQNVPPNVIQQQIQNQNPIAQNIQSNLQNPPNVNGQAIQQPQKAINQTQPIPLINLNNPVNANAPIPSNNIPQKIEPKNNIQQNVEAKVPIINTLSNNLNLAQNNNNQAQNDIQVPPNPQAQQNAQVPNIPEKIAQNVPLPIVNNLLNQPINKKPLPINQNEFRVNKVNNGETVPRQKREVIDCTQKVTLKPEDKQICDTLVDLPSKRSEEILPKVDLNDVGLRKDLNVLDQNGHFGIRSLQSIDEEKR